MSQAIRKLATGDKLVQAGPRKVKYEDFLNIAAPEVDSFLDKQKYKKKEREAFMTAYANLLAGMKDGTVYIDDAGRIVDSQGRYKNAEGKDFDAYGHATRFIKKHIGSTATHKEEEKKEEKKEVKSFEQFFRDKYYGGRTDDLTEDDLNIFKDFDPKGEDGKRAKTGRLKEMENTAREYAKYLIDNGNNDLATKFNIIAARTSDGVIDHTDLQAVASAGIPIKSWNLMFSDDAVEAPKETELQRLQREQTEAAKAKAEAEQLAALQRQKAKDDYFTTGLGSAWVTKGNEWRDKYGHEGYSVYLPTSNLDEKTVAEWDEYFRQHPELLTGLEQRVSNLFNNYNPYEGNFEDYTNFMGNSVGSHVAFSQILDYLIKKKQINPIDGSNYHLPFTLNSDDGTISLWNPVTGRLSKVAAWQIPAIKQYILDDYDRVNTPLKYQQGGNMPKSGMSWFNSEGLLASINDAYNKKQAQEKVELETRAKESGKTVEDQKKAEAPADGVDKTLFWSALLADIASTAMSFVPGVGSTTGFLTGVTGTLLNAAADVSGDGFQWSDAKNFALNLGADFLGIIPVVGTAGKTAKTLKNIKRHLPNILQALTAVGAFSQFPEMAKAFEKIGTDEDLTVEDWRALGTGASLLLGNLGGLGQRAKAKAIRDIAAQRGGSAADTYKIKGKDGSDISLTKEQFDQLSTKTTIDDINKYLKENGKGEAAVIKKGMPGFRKEVPVSPELVKGDQLYNWDTFKEGTSWAKEAKRLQQYKDWESGFFNWLSFPSYATRAKNALKPQAVQTTPKTQTAKPDTKPVVKTTTKPETPVPFGEGLDTLKKGGIIKAQSGQNSNNFFSTRKTLGKDITNSYENARNLELWDTYHNMDDATKQALDIFKNRSTDALLTSLNNLQSHKDLGWNKVLNERGYNKWNQDFNATGLNEIFGWDASRADFMGPTTYNRKKVLDALIKQGTIQGSDGTIKFNGTSWVKEEAPTGPTGPLKPSGIPVPTIEEAINKAPLQKIKSIVNPTGKDKDDNTWKQGFLGQMGKYLPDVIAAGRLIHTLQTNKQAAKKAKEGLKPLLKNPYEIHRQVRGDFFTQQGYHQQAAALQHSIKPFTANMEEYRAAQLDAANKAALIKVQGDAAYNKGIIDSSEKAALADMQNVVLANQVANENKANMLGIFKAKKDIDAALIGANANSVNTYMKELEYRMREKINKQKALDQNYQLANLQYGLMKDPELGGKILATEKDFETWRTTPGNELKTMEQWDANRYAIYKQLVEDYQKRLRDGQYQILSAKDGSKIPVAQIKAKTEAAKMFQKDIQESVKNHIKLIDNLSSVTKQLIIQSMT